ncbi:MAG: hypothetical protein K8T90_22750 [Planctomycetes bacterium]|nr:hypothetical protein [Planctomycetota bacterium]
MPEETTLLPAVLIEVGAVCGLVLTGASIVGIGLGAIRFRRVGAMRDATALAYIGSAARYYHQLWAWLDEVDATKGEVEPELPEPPLPPPPMVEDSAEVVRIADVLTRTSLYWDALRKERRQLEIVTIFFIHHRMRVAVDATMEFVAYGRSFPMAVWPFARHERRERARILDDLERNALERLKTLGH